MVLLSAKTGLVEALLLDNGYLTDVRTAAAGAVAAKHLSRQDSADRGDLRRRRAGRGCSWKRCMLVRPIEEARIWARDAAKADATAAAPARETWHPACAPSRTRAKAAAGADIIVTTTPSAEPLIDAGFVSAGQHITAMGSDAEHKNEIAPAILRLADLYVADSAAQTRRLGELHHAIEAGRDGGRRRSHRARPDHRRAKPGRRSAGDITIADLTGTGVQDTAIATLARDRARAAGAGAVFES